MKSWASRIKGWFGGSPSLAPGAGLPTGGGSEADAYRARIDPATQTLRIDLPPEYAPGELYPAPAALRGAEDAERFVSAAELAQKAKQFDDGLIAAVERAAQDGGGTFAGKARLLREVVTALANNGGPTAATLAAAAQLGGQRLDLPQPLHDRSEQVQEEFLGDELRSKPISFYTWSDELRGIFRQDRLLQSDLKEAAGVEALARTLHAKPEERTTYERYLSMVEWLVNPFSADAPDLRGLLRQLDAGRFAPESPVYRFLPPSRAYETDLIQKLYGNRPIPDGFSLIDELIARVRDGKLALQPEGGWYDWVAWSLEPLIAYSRLPEHQRAEASPRYAKHLEKLFKSLMALARETQIKQLEIPVAGCAMPGPDERPKVTIRPRLDIEPLPTHYLRRMLGYAAVRRTLRETFGDDALRSMHRLTEAGPVEIDLDAELQEVMDLHLGAAGLALRQLGLPAPRAGDFALPQVLGRLPQADLDRMFDAPAHESAIGRFEAWAARADDPDLARDARMMVPVYFDTQRKKTKVWVFLGWEAQALAVYFKVQPRFAVFDRAGKDVTDQVDVKWEGRHARIPTPVSAELYVDGLLDRDAFRALCDRHRRSVDILTALDPSYKAPSRFGE
ncbi:MAG: hypothetical protein HS116_02785 [Planctomycetes bacterium]|nr:hypothetical protein [Planctomycetota bacterium]